MVFRFQLIKMRTKMMHDYYLVVFEDHSGNMDTEGMLSRGFFCAMRHFRVQGAFRGRENSDPAKITIT